MGYVFPFLDVIEFFLGIIRFLPGPFVSFMVVSGALMLFAFILKVVTTV